MLKRFFRMLGHSNRRKSRKQKAHVPRPVFRPEVEVLERREVPATFIWTGHDTAANGDDWNVASNWKWTDPGLPTRPPNAGEVVVLDPSEWRRDPVVKSANATCQKITIVNFSSGSHSITINDEYKLIVAGSTTLNLSTDWNSPYWGIHGEGTIVVKNQNFAWSNGAIGVKHFKFAGNKMMSIFGDRGSQWTWYSDYIHIGQDENGDSTLGGTLRLGGGGASDLNSNITLDTSDITIYYDNTLEFDQRANSDNAGGFTNGRNLTVQGKMKRLPDDGTKAIKVGLNVLVSGTGAEFRLNWDSDLKIDSPGLDAIKSLVIENGGTFDFGPESHLWAWEGVQVKSNGTMNVLSEILLGGFADTYLHGELHVNGGTVIVGNSAYQSMTRLFLTDSYQMRMTGGTLKFSADKSHLTNCSYIAANDIIMAESGTTNVQLDLFGSTQAGLHNYDVLYGLGIFQDDQRIDYGDLNPLDGWSESIVSAGIGEAYRLSKQL